MQLTKKVNGQDKVFYPQTHRQAVVGLDETLGAFDISAYKATGGVLAKYADLTAALGTNGANIPEALRKGGMSVKFVLSSDNKYVQARLMAQNFTTNVTQWQGVDDEPIENSQNLISSNGAFKDSFYIKSEIGQTLNSGNFEQGYEYLTPRLLVGTKIEITNSGNFDFHSYLIKDDATFIEIGLVRVGNTLSYTLQDNGKINNYADYGTSSCSIKILGIKDQIENCASDIENTNNIVGGVNFNSGTVELGTVWRIPQMLFKGQRVSITSVSGSIDTYFIKEDGQSFINLGYVYSGNTLNYVLPENGYIQFYAAYTAISGSVLVIGNTERIWNLEKFYNTQINPLSVNILKRVGCVGDSYTAGFIWTDHNYADYPQYSWPYFMEKLTGEVWENWGYTGSTSKMWVTWNDLKNRILGQGNKCQAYVVGLMINDKTLDERKYPVGVIGDIGTDNDTYYAWYYKVIQLIISVNPNAPIFCNTCPAFENNDPFNQAVRDIVTYCRNNSQSNVFLCDLASEQYNNEQYYKNKVFETDLINGHYTAIGYEFMAECYKRVISDVIINNVSFFRYLHEIVYDNPS